MQEGRKVGVVLFQLGGPDTLENVEPFLYNLFCDPDIIELPLGFLFRRPLARWIARTRGAKVRKYYEQMGGGSPILKLTTRQAMALQEQLSQKMNVKAFVCMRYWHPMTEEVVQQIKKESFTDIVLLPLYPQYSMTTTGSSINEWNRVVERFGLNGTRVRTVLEYCDHPLFVQSFVENIQTALKRVPHEDRSRMHLVFSAHGTPLKLVAKGDPYQSQVGRSYRAILNAGDFKLPHHLCYQSKVGSDKWLEPSLHETIHKLGHAGATHVIVVPLSFVSDHSETLYEINIETREEALKEGIRHFDMCPALNANAHFIGALADVVLRQWQAE